ncbi:MAG: hypothetical protein QM820_23605 [Minicystis sp.]
MSEVETEDLRVMAAEIAAAFGTPPLTLRDLFTPGRLFKHLDAARARVLKSSQYGDCLDYVTDETLLADNTDPEFWSSTSFLVLADPSSDPGSPFEGRCFVLRGPTTAAGFLQAFHTTIRRRLFDLDELVYARSPARLLVATHYGTVALFAPSADG